MKTKSIFVLSTLSMAMLGTAAMAQEPTNTRLLEQISSIHGIPMTTLRVADRVTQNYPLTGVQLHVAKVINTATGKVYQLVQDGTGKSVSLDAVAAAEQKAQQAKYGKLDPRLHAKLAQLPPGQSIPVSIWINVPDLPAKRPAAMASATASTDSAEAARGAVNSRLVQVQTHMLAKRQGVSEALTQMGVAAHEPLYAPAIFADLTSSQIQAIAQHPDVGTLYDGSGAGRGRVSDKATTTQHTYVPWLRGNRGGGVASRPVVHEDDGVADGNTYLNNGTHPVVFWCTPGETGCISGKKIDNHASEVAGVIASTHPLYRGVAPNAQLILSANSQDFSDAKLVDAFEWARANGGDPTNMSWGTYCGGFQDFMSRYVDWATKNLWATFVIAAGNHTTPCSNLTNDEKVSSPGLAWSVITVGSQFDQNTAFWTGDGISGFSDWRNPDFATGMEKPEVVAVGEDVRTTDAAGGDHLTGGGVNGTSFAAPQVAGQVTQILTLQPSLNSWPEANKAIVLASARHDIEAGTSRDGIGAVVMSHSDSTARYGRFNAQGPYIASNFPVSYLDRINLTAGQQVRVAIAWDSNSNGSSSDVLGADLDLRVRHPNNSTIVCSSASVQNAWEMCEFTAPVTGLYDILINKFSSDATWPGTYLGTAWSIKELHNFCSEASSIPSTGGTVALNTADGTSYYDSYSGWADNQSGRERVLKLTLATTKDITFTDNNANLDLHVLQFANCTADPLAPIVKGHGLDSVFINNAPAGTYYLVADGYNGYVGAGTATVSVTGP